MDSEHYIIVTKPKEFLSRGKNMFGKKNICCESAAMRFIMI